MRDCQVLAHRESLDYSVSPSNIVGFVPQNVKYIEMTVVENCHYMSGI